MFPFFNWQIEGRCEIIRFYIGFCVSTPVLLFTVIQTREYCIIYAYDHRSFNYESTLSLPPSCTTYETPQTIYVATAVIGRTLRTCVQKNREHTSPEPPRGCNELTQVIWKLFICA
jgi:hypothetical protein